MSQQPKQKPWERLEAKFEALTEEEQETLGKEVGSVLLKQGKEVLQLADRRRILVRNPEGEILMNVTLVQATIVTALLVLFLPGLGWLMILGGGIWAVNKRLQIQLAREVIKNDDKLKNDDTLMLEE